jgi:3-hydroxybutyryl-CoA dehydrogenase
MSRTFSTIGVIGLGTMGAGIAEVFARNGFAVVGVEQTEEQLERGRQHLEHSTARAVKRGKLSAEEQHQLVDRITFTTALDGVADCDLVIVAVVEHLDVKQKGVPASSTRSSARAVLATNTSSLSVDGRSQRATSEPPGWWACTSSTPRPVQEFVEVVSTVVTEPDVVADVQALARRLGKNPVVIGDKAGFIANALLFGYLNHAVSMYENRYASREDIDAAMRLGAGYPMGPAGAASTLIGLIRRTRSWTRLPGKVATVCTLRRRS